MALGWLGVALRVHWRGPSARLPQASLISRGPAEAGGAPGGLEVFHSELSHVCPVSVRCRDGGSAMRHGLHRLARREAPQRWQGGSPRLRANPWHLYLEAVRRRSGGGPMWIAQIPDSKPLAECVIWL